MSNKRQPGIVFHAGSPLVLCVFLLSAGIVIGLILSGFLTSAEKGNEEQNPELNAVGTTEITPSGDSTQDSNGAAPPENTPGLASDNASKNENTPDDTPEKPVRETQMPPDGFDDATPPVDEKVINYVASMSLREKLCQMLIVTPDAITGVSGTTAAGSVTQAALEKYPVGGLIHFSENITSGEQILKFNTNVQSFSKTPMFIAVDEEGGRVGRLKTKIGAHSVGAMLSYERDGEEKAAENARILSDTLKKYGFNADFAPVADVWSNPENTVIGDRAYSTDFESASRLVSAAVRGFNESGIICSLKHFPGHGDTNEDSHNGAAYIDKTLDELFAGELKPFSAGIEAGADMVMTGHLIVPSADELPATLSERLITGVLRKKLGFNGVIITDSLAMGAISSNYSAEYVAVTAVKAGVDILLMPNGVERTITALTDAVNSGDIPERRIDESVLRIIALKAEKGILVFQ